METEIIIITKNNQAARQIKESLELRISQASVQVMNGEHFRTWFHADMEPDVVIVDYIEKNATYVLDVLSDRNRKGRHSINVVFGMVPGEARSTQYLLSGALYYVTYAGDDYDIIGKRVAMAYQGYGAALLGKQAHIDTVLKELGIEVKHKGYCYVSEILQMAMIQGKGIFRHLEKFCYEPVSEKYNCSVSSVKHGVELCLLRSYRYLGEQAEAVYGTPPKGRHRPGSGHMLLVISDRLEQYGTD